MSQASAAVKNVVLVHGGFVDGSGWQGVYDILKKDGYNVCDRPEPDDVGGRRRCRHEAHVGCAERPGDTRRPFVRRRRDHRGRQRSEGRRASSISRRSLRTKASRCLRSSRTRRPAPQFRRSCHRRTAISSSTGRNFAESFAADVPPDAAAFMADSQVPWGLEALNGAVAEPAWRTKPSWYLVATEDKMIPPDAQRAMSKRAGSTVVEAEGSHAVYVSQPKTVAAIITEAAHGVAVAT